MVNKLSIKLQVLQAWYLTNFLWQYKLDGP